MKILNPSIQIESDIDGEAIIRQIERIGRVCYKSEELITRDSSRKFVKQILMSGHESVIEHCSISVRVICDRGVTHEIVRHRLASYSQESTRYCNYSKEKFGSEITCIHPTFWSSEDSSEKYSIWKDTMEIINTNYNRLIELGATPQEARSILPNSLKTEIVMTMNLREWRHFFRLRTAKAAHPQMREVANLILDEFKKQIPIVFDDISPDN